jgi:hypothetical protein
MTGTVLKVSKTYFRKSYVLKVYKTHFRNFTIENVDAILSV